jgi:anaerobic magnesium-protoporphyrin IX monomethyl ester cyclase
MKIVLFVPDSNDLTHLHPSPGLTKFSAHLPLGVLYLAAAVEAAGHEVIIIDNFLEGMPEDTAVERIIAERPDCVGVSAAILNIWQGFSIAGKLKSAAPEILSVFGGPQPTIDPMGTITREGIDCVVVGEGERAFVDLLEASEAGAGCLAETPGVFSKRPDGAVSKARPPEPVADLSECRWPARHLVDISRYVRTGKGLLAYPVDVVSTSRGCPFTCAFCSSAPLWNRRYRIRTAADVVDEMEFMMREHGTRGFYFREDNFTVSKKHVLGICEEILRRRLDVVWECESRVDTLPRDVMARMVEAGLRAIWCGVESGSQRILDIVHKGIKVSQILQFYKDAHELGLHTGASFMVGIPGETEEDAWKTFELAKEIYAGHTTFASYLAFPGSELYEQVRKDGLYSHSWESILFVDTPSLDHERVLELERAFTARLRSHRMLKHPVQTVCRAVLRRVNQRRHA